MFGKVLSRTSCCAPCIWEPLPRTFIHPVCRGRGRKLSWNLLALPRESRFLHCKWFDSHFKFILQTHCWFLEHWNRQKSLTNIWQYFSSYLMNGLQKYIYKKKLRWLFEVIHIIGFEMHMDLLCVIIDFPLERPQNYPLSVLKPSSGKSKMRHKRSNA